MSDVVTYERKGDVAVVTVCNPPVNALSHAVRVGLLECLQQAVEDAKVKTVVLLGQGRSFPAGSDIAEFGKPIEKPWLPNVCAQIENCPKPVVAALHGTALGGGFELALASHYRISLATTRIGFPEVTLGILPGAGGTQRAPRLAGADVTLDMMISGKPMSVSAPGAAVFFDKIVEENLRLAAVDYAQMLADTEAPVRPTRDATVGFSDPAGYQAAIRARRKAVKDRRQIAPAEIVRCVEAAELLPFDIGMEFEGEAFDALVRSDQADALCHAFFAERTAARFPEVKTGQAHSVERIGIVGAGLRGIEVAVSCLGAGCYVTLIESKPDVLKGGLAKIDALFARYVSGGRMTAAGKKARKGRLASGGDIRALRDADFVIEAVGEDMAIKGQVFAALDTVTKDAAILATSTSFLDVNEIADITARPESVVGIQFIAPAHVTRLVEIMVGDETAPDTVVTAIALARKLGKIPVRSGMRDGGMGHRVASAYCRAADVLLGLGATPYQIDAAMLAYGMALGPYQMIDRAGLDSPWGQGLLQGAEGASDTVGGRLLQSLKDAGRLGFKTGGGYYAYGTNDRTAKPDPDVITQLKKARGQSGAANKTVSAGEIQRRCLTAMINEGARMYCEGVATRPSDIDMVMVHGFGFPRWRGGPMKAADISGLLGVRRDLLAFAPDRPDLWAPDPLFDRLIRNGQRFSTLNTSESDGGS